jgi:hypothetical protein
VHINLHLTDTTDLRAEGYVLDGRLFAEIRWGSPDASSNLGDGALWGTPETMRRLAELAVQAAIQAEEEAAWQAHTAGTRPTQEAQVA